MTIPASTPPQLTIKAVVLGIVLAAVLAGANAYLGLFAGLTVSASIPAAVMSMALLRLFKNSNILENNIVQTAASAGESIAAGAIFTFPALVLLDYWTTFDYFWVTTIAGVGGVLGVLFTVPLRRSLIIEQNLAFPEGTATAAVLKSGSGRGVVFLAWAAVLGALVKLAETGFRLWPATAQAATFAGQSTVFYVGTNLSPALLSVGFIVRLNIAVLIFLGGAISWYIAIPIYSTFFLAGDAALSAQLASGVSAADLAGSIWSTQIRYLGVGAMVVGGIWALVSLRSSIINGLKSGFANARAAAATHNGNPLAETDRDAPMLWVLVAIAVLVVPIGALYYAIIPVFGVALAMTIIMVVAGFLFSAVAGYMAGVVGSSNNPVSGVTIATILLTSLLLLGLLGPGDSVGAPAAILVGAVVCCAAAIGGDNLQDLKAGYILGATPWRQQLMQVVGVISAALVMAPILNLLLNAYGMGAPTDAHPNSLAAPQAQIMASVAAGVFGAGLPWGMVIAGGFVGAAIICLDEYLKAHGASWRAPVLAVAVGIYLPLELSVTILAGGLIAHAVSMHARRPTGAVNSVSGEKSSRGILFAAGLITGEALAGIFMAIPIVLSEDANVFAIGVEWPAWFGLAVVSGIGIALYRVARSG
jgi:putative OPT family oligopeptide transporter